MNNIAAIKAHNAQIRINEKISNINMKSTHIQKKFLRAWVLTLQIEDLIENK